MRPHAIIVAFLLVPVNVLFAVWGTWTVGSGGAADSMAASAVASLCLLSTLNAVTKRWGPRWVFSRAELITIYLVLAISTGLGADVWEWGASLSTTIAWPVWNAGPENQWADIMLPNIPTWLTPANRDALEGFFLGRTNPYQAHILHTWLTPALWWTAWVTALLWVSLCLNVIVVRRWSREQHLPFPMTTLPLRMTEPDGELFRRPLWWAGIIAAAAITILNTIAQLVPAVPRIPLSIDFGTYITNNKPWDALRCPAAGWDPWVLGLSYLMPADLAFSLIVFNLLWRSEYVLSRLWGWTISPWSGFPYGDQQTIGAYIALIAAVIWLDRRYLLQVLRRAAGLSSHAHDSDEAFGYRTAVVGAMGGLAFLWWFFARAGVGPAIIAVFLALYFIMVMVMGRMRAQLGPPSHEMVGAMPIFALTEFPGTRALGPRALGLLAVINPYMTQHRSNPAPTQLEALRMAERASINPTRLAWIVIAIIPVGMLAYFWASIGIGYRLGLGTGSAHAALTLPARYTFAELDVQLRNPLGPNWSGLGAIGVGLAGYLALMAVKLRFPLWPLHPVAFPLAFAWPIDYITPAVIATWIVKVLLLRYGGLRAHLRALPFFLGLLAGSGSVAAIQSIIFRILRVGL